MCRLIAYLGHPVLIADVLIKPVNSIINQSLSAQESEIKTNGDGFGLGWYAPEIDGNPAVFTSIFPAWSDQNLVNLTAKIKSPAFFAHVRAASSGGVAAYNCHPFIHENMMMMHNGQIADFSRIKRHMRRVLEDEIYNWIKGETDSEHLFALFLHFAKRRALAKGAVMAEVLEETLQQVLALHRQQGIAAASFFNICITNGKQMVASRCCSDPLVPPETLHYATGAHFLYQNQVCHIVQASQSQQLGCALVTSEKLTQFDIEWHDVLPNHLLIIDENFKIEQRPLRM